MTTPAELIELKPWGQGEPTARVARVINGREVQFSFDRNRPSQRYICDVMEALEWYESETVEALVGTLKEGDTFFDVGAHCGYFSIIAAALVGATGKVVAFEPNADNFDALKFIPGVQAHNVAVGEKRDKVSFYLNLDNDGGHALWNPAAHPFNTTTREMAGTNGFAGLNEFEVEQVTLDDFGELRPAAIKIDTEGAEVLVLRGAEKLLKQPQLRLLVCEFNQFGLDQLGCAAQELIHILIYNGFAIDHHETGWVENLICRR